MYDWAVNQEKLRRAIRISAGGDESVVHAEYVKLGGLSRGYVEPDIVDEPEQPIEDVVDVVLNEPEESIIPPKKLGRPKK